MRVLVIGSEGECDVIKRMSRNISFLNKHEFDFSSVDGRLPDVSFNPHHIDVLLIGVGRNHTEHAEAMKYADYVWEKNNHIIVSFITDSESIAVTTHFVPHLSVIKKPLRNDNFKAAMEKIALTYEIIKNNEMPLRVPVYWNKKINSISEYEIMYIYKNNYGITIVTVNGELRHSGRLEDFTEQLSLQTFIQCQKSCVVNLKFVKTIANGRIIMSNGISLKISRPFVKSVKSFLKSNYALYKNGSMKSYE